MMLRKGMIEAEGLILILIYVKKKGEISGRYLHSEWGSNPTLHTFG